MRIKIIRLVTYFLFVIIALNLFYLQVIKGRYFYNLSKNNRVRIVPLEGERGEIKDRNGKILAGNKVSYHLMITPQDIKNETELFSFLGKILVLSERKLRSIYKRRKSTPFSPVKIAEDISRNKAIILEENKYRFPSLFIQKGFKRIYPFEENSAHLLGYIGKINKSQMRRLKEYGYSQRNIIGKTGIEEYYDNYLKADQGGLQVEVNSRGQQVRLLSFKEAQKGQNLSLTIDADISQLSATLLGERRGSIILMDLNNGEILSMTSAPSYDPNIFVDRKKRKNIDVLLKNKFSPFLNRAISGLFPPGSVFKVPVGIGGMASEEITQYTIFDCEGLYSLAGINFRCEHVHGHQNLVESIIHSCNIYYYHLGQILGADKINHYATLFGLGGKTHIDLPFEAAGVIPSPQNRLLKGKRRWYTGDTLNFSIGQGEVLTTPIQLVKMISIVANEGEEVQPHLIKSIGDVEVDKFSSKRVVKIKKNIFKIMKKALRATVADYSGTAHTLDIRGLQVSGKTGTAQSSSNKEHHAWFVGYVKGESKRFAFCVFLEHGGSSRNACLLGREFLLGLQKINKI